MIRKFIVILLLMVTITSVGCMPQEKITFEKEIKSVARSAELPIYYCSDTGQRLDILQSILVNAKYDTEHHTLYAMVQGWLGSGFWGNEQVAIQLFYDDTNVITKEMLLDKDRFHWEIIEH